MSVTTSGPEIILSSPKCVTTSSSKTQSNNSNNIVVDDQMDNDYRNSITMKTNENGKQGEQKSLSKFYFGRSVLIDFRIDIVIFLS